MIQRLNAVVPGRWRQQFQTIPAEFAPAGSRRVYLACRLIVTLPVEEGGPDVDAVYEDLGEMDSGSFAGVKALYSDARKRAAVAAGIGAYLYTSLEAVVLPIGPQPRQVQCIRRQGKSDLLVLSAETEQWLRHGYQTRMSTEAVRRDLGEILAHGEPENGIGQGEVADQAAQPAGEQPASRAGSAGEQRARRGRDRRLRRPRTRRSVMSTPQLAEPALAGSAAPPTAAQLAARIEIPRRLPPRYDGQPLQHLSHSSVTRFWLCPESFRRYYVCGERHAPTGAMFLGRCVDDAITLYYRRILEHGERLVARPGQGRVLGWLEGRRPRPSASSSGSPGRKTCARTARSSSGSTRSTCRSASSSRGSASRSPRSASSSTSLAPGLEWSVQCYLDLETRAARSRRAGAGGRRLQGQVDAADRVQGRQRLPAVGVPRRALARGRPGFQDK